MSLTPLGSPNIGLVVAHSDITERKIAEDALRETHGELEERVAVKTEELAEANLELRREI